MNFYHPTPEGVIEQMTMGVDLEGKTVLEPSAGSGNIVDHVKKLGASQVLVYEKEPELRDILEKKAKVMGNDFLKADKNDLSHVNYIIMNPPFSNADEYILKAWEVSPEGCETVAICNTETIDLDK